jgi:hypothetical protein
MEAPELEKPQKARNAGILSRLLSRLNQRIFGGIIRVYYVLLFVIVLAIVLPIALYFTLHHKGDPFPVIDLGYARYRGIATDQNVNIWRGMRFARPPTGEYRFAAPADPVTETEVQNAQSVSFFFFPSLRSLFSSFPRFTRYFLLSLASLVTFFLCRSFPSVLWSFSVPSPLSFRFSLSVSSFIVFSKSFSEHS